VSRVTETQPKPREGVLALFLGLTVATSVFGLLTMTLDDRWGFACLGLMVTAIFLVPFFRAEQAALSLWGLVFFVVAIGMGVRGLMISFGYPSEAVVDTLFLQGSTFTDTYNAAALTLAIMGASVAGYLMSATVTVKARAPKRGGGMRAEHLTGTSIALISGAFLAVGLYGTLTYSRAVGGLSADIASRRTTIGGAGQFESHGGAEYLASFGHVGAVFLLAAWLSRHKRLGPVRVAVLIAAFGLGFSINLVTTARDDLVYVSAAALAVVAIIRGTIPKRILVGLALVILVAIGALTAQRTGEQDARLGVGYGLESALLNRNAVDISKTLKITDAVPERLPYQNGKTIASYAIAPIPRALWPDKPVISPGPIIGRTLYGLQRTGIPPGMSAELVWNFGGLAAVPLGFLVGLLLGIAERRWWPVDPRNLTSVLFYALVVLTLGKAVYGVAIGQALSSALQTAVLIALVAMIGVVLRGAHDARQRRHDAELRRHAALRRQARLRV
jgi:hypothetical protein